jgi:hypothetical protein
MKPARIRGATTLCDAPAGWDEQRDGPCGALLIREIGDPRHGAGFVESAWMPDEAERAQIAAGHHVILRVIGWQMPVAIYVDPQEPEPGAA